MAKKKCCKNKCCGEKPIDKKPVENIDVAPKLTPKINFFLELIKKTFSHE
jgi:hypothetical protein